MLEWFEDIVEDFIVVFVGGCVDDVVDVDDVVFDLVEYFFHQPLERGRAAQRTHG